MRHNRLLHVIAPDPASAPSGEEAATTPSLIRIHQDANVYVGELDAGVSVSLPLRTDRQLYVVAAEGSAAVSDHTQSTVSLGTRDGLEVVNRGGKDEAVTVTAGGSGVHVMLIEMKRAL